MPSGQTAAPCNDVIELWSEINDSLWENEDSEVFAELTSLLVNISLILRRVFLGCDEPWKPLCPRNTCWTL